MSYNGTVKSFSSHKGFGFLVSTEAEGDIYFQRRDLPVELQDVVGEELFNLQGRSVTFELTTTQDGKPQARSVQVLASEGDRAVGVVKTFSEKNGYGFLSSPMVDGDVYFQKRDMPYMFQNSEMRGLKVTFGINTMKDGKTQGRDLSVLGDMVGSNNDMSAHEIAVAAHIRTANGGGQLAHQPVPRAQAPMMGQPDEAPSLVGRVKSFDPSKGFGFLSVGQFPQDVYFKSAEPIMVGQEVSFNLHWTQDGKPQARNIGSAMAFGEVCVGFVKRYSAQTGYGFLAIEGGRQDIYFKRTDLPMEYQASMSLDGAQVQFHVKTAADGKPQAEDIMILAAAMPTQGMPTQGMKRSASGPPLLHRGPAANYAAAVPGPDAKRARPNFLPAAFTPGAVAASHAAQQMAQARTAYGGGMPAAYGGGGYQAQPSGGRHAGMVKTFNAQKGFGFIVSPTVPGDVFFQRVGLPPAYQNVDLMGAQVSFMLKYAEDGKPQGNMVLVQG